jgi:putative endonuclease
MKRGTCAVYIMTNRKRTVLYTGVTSDLLTRVAEHRAKTDPGSFASRYNADRLVYFETTLDIESAIAREKQIKGWLRRRKIELIESVNREWNDLAADWSL